MEMGTRYTSPPAHAVGALSRITPVEMRIWRLLCATDEPTVKELEALLGCSRKTLELHITKLYRKLEVRSRVGLVRKAVQHGIIHCPCMRCGPVDRRHQA
jgi:DNA-binding CsgD family transcriptional regulator